MAAVGVTQKAGNEILQALDQYEAEIKKTAEWLYIYSGTSQGIKGDQAYKAAYNELAHYTNEFVEISKTKLNKWYQNITAKIENYKGQDTTYASNLTGKKS